MGVVRKAKRKLNNHIKLLYFLYPSASQRKLDWIEWFIYVPAKNAKCQEPTKFLYSKKISFRTQFDEWYNAPFPSQQVAENSRIVNQILIKMILTRIRYVPLI